MNKLMTNLLLSAVVAFSVFAVQANAQQAAPSKKDMIAKLDNFFGVLRATVSGPGQNKEYIQLRDGILAVQFEVQGSEDVHFLSALNEIINFVEAQPQPLSRTKLDSVTTALARLILIERSQVIDGPDSAEYGAFVSNFKAVF